jgi:hypothetical protein
MALGAGTRAGFWRGPRYDKKMAPPRLFLIFLFGSFF